MKYKAVIFDFNGTLYWDTAYHNQAWDIFLKNHNIALTDEEKAIKIHGKSNDDILRGLFERRLSMQEIHQMGIEKEQIYHKIALSKKMEYAPGAIDFFLFLKSKEIPYTIATSSAWINIDFYISNMHLANWVDLEKIVYDNRSFMSKPS